MPDEAASGGAKLRPSTIGIAHRLEIVRHDVLVVVDVLERSLGRRRVVVDLGVVCVHLPHRWQARHRGRGLDAGDGAQPVEQALIQLGAASRGGIVHGGQRHLEGDEPRAIEAGIDVDQVVDRPEQQPGARDEHHGQRDFSHHEAAADQVPRRAGRLHTSLFERRHQLLDPCVHQGREAEDDAGGQREAQREQQDRRIDRQLARSRQAVGIETHDRLDAHSREHQAEGPADER